MKQLETTVKTYDLDRKDFPEEKGLHIRSKQVFRCEVCLAFTNEVRIENVKLGGWFTLPLCPHEKEDWHVSIMERQRAAREVRSVEFREQLFTDIVNWRIRHAHHIGHNLLGDYDLSTVKAIAHRYVYLSPERPVVPINTAMEEWVNGCTTTPFPIEVGFNWEDAFVLQDLTHMQFVQHADKLPKKND